MHILYIYIYLYMKTIVDFLEQLAINDGYTTSYIPWVSFFRSTLSSPREKLMYQSRIIIVARWEKIWYINGKTLYYNSNNYLVLAIPMAFECETKENVLALSIDINLKLLWEVIADLWDTNNFHWDINDAVNAIPLQQNLKNSVIQLLRIAQNEEESKILWENILKEILYRVLRDKHANALFALHEEWSDFARFSQLVHKINSNISEDYSLNSLSKDMAMSETSLYRYFKKYTSQSPVQYIKNIRLQQAKEILLQNRLTVKEVSKQVGYKSSSQFSREFHSYFGFTPKETNIKK